jgi:FKBP-type peptidyl-prolyl cis-trans isomerase 2
MTIKKNDFVEIDYTATLDETGAIFDTTKAGDCKDHKNNHTHAPAIVCIGQGHLLKGIEDGLIGKAVGDYEFKMGPELAFGKKDAKLISMIPLNKFKQQNIKPAPGLQINVDGRIGHVRKVGGGRAIVDFNHPFSGKDVTYNVTVKRLVTDKKEQVECMIARMMSGLPFKVSEKDKKISVVGPKLPDQLIKPIIDKIKEVTGETIVFEQDKKEAKSIKNAEVR